MHKNISSLHKREAKETFIIIMKDYLTVAFYKSTQVQSCSQLVQKWRHSPRLEEVVKDFVSI